MSGAHPGPMLAALALLTVVRAQIVEPGMCPFSSTPANWNEEEFVAGPWYEIKALTLSGLHDANPRPGCTRWHLSPSGDGRGLHARLAYRTREGDAVVRAFAQYTMSELHPRFNMTFHDLGGSGVSRSVDMKLVAADYGDFALLLGCSEPNLFERKVVSWMLSRSPFLSEAAQEALHTLYSRHGIHAEKFVDTAHDEATCSGATDVAWTAATGTTRTSGAVDMTALPESRVHDTSASLPSSRDEIFRGNAVGEVSTASALPNYILEDTFNSRGVSWSYLGSPWLVRGQLWAVLLALAVLALLACVVACKAAGGRLQRSGSKPVLPLHRQDVVVATLGGSVDYSRFGGFGQGLTRKHVSEPNAGSPNA